MVVPRLPFVAAVILTVLPTAIPAPAAHAADEINSLAAVVNGKPITRSEVQNVIRAQAMLLRRKYPAGGEDFRNEMATLEKNALQDLIDRELILAAFDKNDGAIKPQYLDDDLDRVIREQFENDRKKFLDDLKKSGMTIKKFRELREKMLVVQFMRASQTNDLPPPTPAERDAFLREHPDEFREPSFVHLRTITILKFPPDQPGVSAEAQKALAEEIRSRLMKGADFASEARTYSQDSFAADGGDRGTLGEDSPLLNPTLKHTAFSMKEGQISDVIEDPYAFYILWCEAIKKGKLKDRDAIENELNQRVMLEKRKAATEAWLERLRRKATIRIYD